MKTTYILSFSLAFLLFSCGARHEDKQPGQTENPNSVQQNKTDSVPAEISALEKLAAAMLASRESYSNDGSTEAEETFIKALVEALKQPGSFENNFASLKQYEIKVLTADDQKLRLFYWLSPYSGSMWHVQNIVQYQGKNNSITAVSFNELYEDKDDEGSPTPFFEHIHSLHTSPETIYLLTGYGQMSGTEPYSVSHTLVIDQSKFDINKPLFLIGKAVKSQLFASAPLKEDQDKEKLRAQLDMIYNPQDKTITYPEVSETKDGSVFNGKRKALTFRDGMFR